MRIIAITSICLASLLANPYIDVDLGNVGAGALLLWPTARSTGLAGAMTGLADEADAAFFNPAGLAFQTTAKADITYASWLPGLYPGMLYASAMGGAPLHLQLLRDRNIYLAGSLTGMTLGETDIVNEHGDFLGRVTVWRGAAAASAAMLLTDRLGVGIGLKVLHDSHYGWSWDGEVFDEGTAAAADIALLYRAITGVSIGAAVDNLGPPLVYRPSGEPDDLPRTARLGLCWTPIDSRNVRLRLMPELDKLLVGMFKDTTGRKPLGRQLQEEWMDVRKAAGIEATAFRLVSLRLGYFEDLTHQLGGVVLEKEGQTYHYGLWDALSRKGLGQFKSIGLCWGIGVGTDRLRFDLSSDAAIYDFPTANCKLQLTSNDLGGLF
jgi:hypothetical protein